MVELPAATTDRMRFADENGDPVDIRRCRLEFKRSPERIGFEVGSYSSKTPAAPEGGRLQLWDGNNRLLTSAITRL